MEKGYRNNKNEKENMNTTLEIPEGTYRSADAGNDCLCRECDCGSVD